MGYEPRNYPYHYRAFPSYPPPASQPYGSWSCTPGPVNSTPSLGYIFGEPDETPAPPRPWPPSWVKWPTL